MFNMCAGVETTFRSEKPAQLGWKICQDGRLPVYEISSSQGGVLRGDDGVHQGGENEIQGRC